MQLRWRNGHSHSAILMCDFETTENNGRYTHVCKACGYRIETGRPEHRATCKALPQDILSLGVRYASAKAKWLAAGSPRRSRDDRTAIHAICNECVHKLDDKCRLCGCGLTAKIRMATTECPIRKW